MSSSCLKDIWVGAKFWPFFILFKRHDLDAVHRRAFGKNIEENVNKILTFCIKYIEKKWQENPFRQIATFL